MLYKKLFQLILGMGLSAIAFSVFATENIAKEEITPPPAEGALSLDQIPPITTAPNKTNSPNPPPPPQAPTVSQGPMNGNESVEELMLQNQ